MEYNEVIVGLMSAMPAVRDFRVAFCALYSTYKTEKCFMCTVTNQQFNDFNVYSLNDSNIFIHINLTEKSFYKSFVKYFWDESRLLRYAENKANLSFTPSKRNYITLYKHLGYYIDEYNLVKLPATIGQEVLKILADEYQLNDPGDGNLQVRLDKIGKIGEYLFCNLLSEYFKFNCIIPKVHLTTDFNMSIYGIDTLFYSTEKNMILLGESKLSKSLENGIGLINKSLKTYEQQIKDEFVLMLSNRFLKNNLGIFGEKYADAIELSLSIEEFITNASIKRIGIPIFIAHGIDTDIDEILKQMKSIKQNTFLGIETQYIIISLPIVNKSKLISVLTQEIAERRTSYERFAAQQ